MVHHPMLLLLLLFSFLFAIAHAATTTPTTTTTTTGLVCRSRSFTPAAGACQQQSFTWQFCTTDDSQADLEAAAALRLLQASLTPSTIAGSVQRICSMGNGKPKANFESMYCSVLAVSDNPCSNSLCAVAQREVFCCDYCEMQFLSVCDPIAGIALEPSGYCQPTILAPASLASYMMPTCMPKGFSACFDPRETDNGKAAAVVGSGDADAAALPIFAAPVSVVEAEVGSGGSSGISSSSTTTLAAAAASHMGVTVTAVASVTTAAAVGGGGGGGVVIPVTAAPSPSNNNAVIGLPFMGDGNDVGNAAAAVVATAATTTSTTTEEEVDDAGEALFPQMGDNVNEDDAAADTSLPQMGGRAAAAAPQSPPTPALIEGKQIKFEKGGGGGGGVMVRKGRRVSDKHQKEHDRVRGHMRRRKIVETQGVEEAHEAIEKRKQYLQMKIRTG